GQEGQFLALGIGGADDMDSLHAASRAARPDASLSCCFFVRRSYRIGMLGSRQPEPGSIKRREPRARTGRLMLDTAIRLMQDGHTPSVSDVAEAAGVSRATAYRYFPSQAALVQAVVGEGLGPILEWQSDSRDACRRV